MTATAGRPEQLYEQELGGDAAERQKWLAVDRHRCCGERFADGHHVACSKRPADEPAQPITGQQSLAH